MSGILGIKIGMSQIFTPAGERVSVTLISTDGCVVVQNKSKEKEGYNAVQVGIGTKSISRVSKPLKKHFEKAKVKPTRWLKEFRLDEGVSYQPGQSLDLDFLKEGDWVKVRGVTKGRGFSGSIKRWGFKGGPGGHGSCFHRRPGSIGNHTYPSRVFKRRPMPGHYGVDQLTVKNKVMGIIKEENLLIVKGSVPGSQRGLLEIRKI